MEFQGKNYLVTGASSGIGKAVVEYLDEKGASVVLVARDQGKMEQVVSTCQSTHYLFPYDLQEVNHIEDIFSFSKEKGILFDGMIHCAGIGGSCPVKVNDIELADQLMKVNYHSFLELCHYFSKKKYTKDGSVIIGLSSISARALEKGTIPYASAKYAMESAIRIMSKEFISRGIRVNGVQPGFVHTPLIGDEVEGQEDFIVRQPLGMIEPENIAKVISFLLSEDARYITGALLPISGGYDYGI